MATVTPEDRLEQIQRDRADYDRARSRLFRHIGEALEDAKALPAGEKRKLGPSAIGRAARFTREYIAQLRDGQ
ncbi:MAG: hypothetical protein M3Y33_11060 [Actinomycetota bacterium]|nr:hypothetical protein [Actinomycetota bacterium]